MRASQIIFLILIMWNDTDTPLAYFISFRTYGTWLHGDKRGSIDRFHNRYRSPYLPPNKKWLQYNQQQLKTKPLILRAKQRKSIEVAIRETCRIRKWSLLAFNIRTNHVHTVVTANRKPELVLNAFKANATRQLREDGLWCHPFSLLCQCERWDARAVSGFRVRDDSRRARRWTNRASANTAGPHGRHYSIRRLTGFTI